MSCTSDHLDDLAARQLRESEADGFLTRKELMRLYNLSYRRIDALLELAEEHGRLLVKKKVIRNRAGDLWRAPAYKFLPEGADSE